jgi:hypothetical protein
MFWLASSQKALRVGTTHLRAHAASRTVAGSPCQGADGLPHCALFERQHTHPSSAMLTVKQHMTYYLFVCVHVRRDALFAKGLLRVQQYLAGGRDNTTCPICLGGIKPTEAIWACGKSCYALFHMTCIQVGVTTLSISSAEGEVLWVGWTVDAKVAAVTAALRAAAHVPFKCHAHMWAC